MRAGDFCPRCGTERVATCDAEAGRTINETGGQRDISLFHVADDHVREDVVGGGGTPWRRRDAFQSAHGPDRYPSSRPRMPCQFELLLVGERPASGRTRSTQIRVKRAVKTSEKRENSSLSFVARRS